jgi:hypothetical protein
MYTVPDLGNDALETDPAGVLEHGLAVDPEGFAELDVDARDDLLQFGLAADQRLLPNVRPFR